MPRFKALYRGIVLACEGLAETVVLQELAGPAMADAALAGGLIDVCAPRG